MITYLKNKSVYYLASLFLILFLSTCNKVGKDFINPSDIKIYINDLEEASILPLEMWATSDNGFLVFGVCGSSVVTKFDGDGDIYLLKINADGTTKWGKCFSIFEGGFPTNVIQVDENHYTFIWNDISIGGNHAHKVSINVGTDAASTVLTSSPAIDFECTFDCHYVTSIVDNVNADGFTILGIGNEAVNDTLSINKTFILQTDEDFKNPKTISEKEFYSEGITTGIALDNLSVVQVIDHHNQLIADKNSYIFTAPIANQMSLAHVGELDAIYRDDNFWVGAINYLGEGEISMVVNNPQIFGSPTYFIPDFHLNTTTKFDFSSLPNKNEIFDLDTEEPTFIKTIGEDLNKQILVGTTTEGQISIHVYDLLTDQKEKEFHLGQGTRYQASAVTVSFDKKSIAIIGVTTISHQVQRPFLIKINKNELF